MEAITINVFLTVEKCGLYVAFMGFALSLGRRYCSRGLSSAVIYLKLRSAVSYEEVEREVKERRQRSYRKMLGLLRARSRSVNYPLEFPLVFYRYSLSTNPDF